MAQRHQIWRRGVERCSDGCLSMLNGLISHTNMLIISLMMKAEWQWIFSLNLVSKQPNRWHKTGHIRKLSLNQRARVGYKITPKWHVRRSYFSFPFYTWNCNFKELVSWIFSCIMYICHKLAIAHNNMTLSSENIWKCIVSPSLYSKLMRKR